jgi:uncharacterized Zn-binding protein involved in type VI secretion
VDTAGGKIVGNLAPKVLVNGSPIGVKGAVIEAHAPNVPPHITPVMVGASGTVFANGIAVCRAGDLASCDHSATGSANVLVG